MKYLLHRLTALLLAGLLLLSAGAELVFAAQPGLDPICELGTKSWDMLSGGGRQVQTEAGLFYIDEADGSVWSGQTGTMVCEGPAAKLNYANGVLYFARIGEECFDLCALDLETGEERVLLENFAGALGQLYLVDGERLDFSCDNAIWELDLVSGEYRLILFALELWSFVPTACGPVYATGSLFDYSLYAAGHLLAEHVENYYVDLDSGNGILVYSQDGEDLQLDLAAAFAGVILPAEFGGVELISLSSDAPSLPSREEQEAAFEAEVQRLNEEQALLLALPENQAELEPSAPDPALADPNDPQLPEEILDQLTQEPEPSEEPAPIEEPVPSEEPAPSEEPVPSEEPAPVEEPVPSEESVPVEEPVPVEDAPIQGPALVEAQEPLLPAEGSAADAPLDPAARGSEELGEEEIAPLKLLPQVSAKLYRDETALRRSLSVGVVNIVRRARQMLNIRWTPRRNIQGWKGGFTFTAGTTYTGIPYGQSMTYVPWYASLTEFRDAVNDPGSKMYSTWGPSSQSYGTDCSGFVSWAWDLNQRTLNNNQAGMAAAQFSTRVGRDYALIEVGDALIREDSGWTHSRLVTDVTYYSDGSIRSIEVSEANPAASHDYCCYSTVYSGTNLQNVVSGSYAIYRSHTRSSATYTHDCAVPLEGDVCPYCGLSGDGIPELEYVLPGVDLSYAQGNVNWNSLSPQIGFAILRIGYRGYVNPVIGKDSSFEANVQGCEAHSIPYGLYFYAGATTPEQAVEEAKAALEYLGPDHKPNLPVFYDVEENNNILKLSDQELLAVITAFCEEIENAGFRAGIYSSTSVWNTQLTDPSYDRWVRWVAQWESEKLTAAKGASVWQFDCKGRLAGISQDVDMNYWLGDVGEVETPVGAAIVPATCANPGVLLCTDIASENQMEVLDERPILPLGHVYSAWGVCARCGERKEVQLPFTDVKSNKWYTDAVRFVTENGLFNGLSETSFGPSETMTRAMMVTVLHRLAGKPAAGPAAVFTDLKAGGYYVKAVNWGYERGIVSGKTATTFAPNDQITREQAAAFFYRYLISLNPEALSFADLDSFPDHGSVSKYALKALSWAVGAGIIKGSGSGGQSLLLPKDNATRAEVATMFMRFAEYLEKRGLWEGAY